MLTQSHMLINLAIFGKPKAYARNTVALIAGIVPDAAIFVLYGWERAKGTPSSTIWNDIYFNSLFWKDVVAWGNSAPLYFIFALIGLLICRINKAIGSIIAIFGAACLIHIAADFPVHVDDAHRHFFPLSDYKFISPISYWNSAHYGQYFQVFELLLGLSICAWLLARYKSLFSRTLLGFLITAYIAVPIYFSLSI